MTGVQWFGAALILAAIITLAGTKAADTIRAARFDRHCQDAEALTSPGPGRLLYLTDARRSPR